MRSSNSSPLSLTRVAAATLAAVVLLSACGKKDQPAQGAPAGGQAVETRGRSRYASARAARSPAAAEIARRKTVSQTKMSPHAANSKPVKL